MRRTHKGLDLETFSQHPLVSDRSKLSGFGQSGTVLALGVLKPSLEAQA